MRSNPHQGIFCPRCHRGISSDRIGGMTVVCDSCGFVISGSEQHTETANHRRFVFAAFGIILFFAAGLWQVNLWDQYALEVVPLQVRGILGISSDKDHERLAQICLERKRFTCVEREYSRVAKDDLIKIFRLAKFQLSRQHYEDAVRSFGIFFQKGGSDAEAAFMFARALAHQGRHDEASRFFKYVIDSHPDAILKSAASNGYADAVASLSRHVAGSDR